MSVDLLDDLRQGVTPAAHQALDLLDQLRDVQGDLYVIQHLDLGKWRASQASRTVRQDNRRQLALQAAAHLILAVEIMDRGGDGA